ncbi:hypothetical protein MLD38_015701 [Melastoma candidum]|uniref:Uncharacterized protein n=1 Tax=Melastoma candidum TaxID=119954 RepID=A0ACB9RIB2_9MYRT|nr:hypothetical protein MLD38_015701 [Melastoma candidum]
MTGAGNHKPSRCQKRDRSWRCKEMALDGKALCQKHHLSYQIRREGLRSSRKAKTRGDSPTLAEVSVPGDRPSREGGGVFSEDAGLFTHACDGNGAGTVSKCGIGDVVAVLGLGYGNVAGDREDGGVCGGTGGGTGGLPGERALLQRGLGGEASGDGSAGFTPKRGRPFGSKDKRPRKRRSRRSLEVVHNDSAGRAGTENVDKAGAIAPIKRGRPRGSKYRKWVDVEAVVEGTSGEVAGTTSEGDGRITEELNNKAGCDIRSEGEKRGKDGGTKPVTRKKPVPLHEVAGSYGEEGDRNGGSSLDLKKKRGRPLGSKNRNKKNPSDVNVGFEGEKNPENGGSELVPQEKIGCPLGSTDLKRRNVNNATVGRVGEENCKSGVFDLVLKKRMGRPLGSKNQKLKNSGSEPSKPVHAEPDDGLSADMSNISKEMLEHLVGSENLNQESRGDKAEGESEGIACIPVFPTNLSNAKNNKNEGSELTNKGKLSFQSRSKSWKQKSYGGDNEGIMKEKGRCSSPSKARMRKGAKKGKAGRKSHALAHTSDSRGKATVVCALEGKEGYLRVKADKGIGKVPTLCKNHGNPSSLADRTQRKVSEMVWNKVRLRRKMGNRKRGRGKGPKSVPSVRIETLNRESTDLLDIEQVVGL